MAKGEIAQDERFLFLPQFFQKSSAADASKCVYKLERMTGNCDQTISVWPVSKDNNRFNAFPFKDVFEFLLFPQYFLKLSAADASGG